MNDSEPLNIVEQTEKTRRKEYELFHDGELGRCPECGRLIMLPCKACGSPESEAFEGTEDFNESDLEPDLDEPERRRYEYIRAYREKYGISPFEDEQRIKRFQEIIYGTRK